MLHNDPGGGILTRHCYNDPGGGILTRHPDTAISNLGEKLSKHELFIYELFKDELFKDELFYEHEQITMCQVGFYEVPNKQYILDTRRSLQPVCFHCPAYEDALRAVFLDNPEIEQTLAPPSPAAAVPTHSLPVAA